MYSNLEPMLLTSDDSALEPAFTGYAFAGAHLIVGEAGYAEWLRSGRSEVALQQDGCYMVVRSGDGNVEIGADFKGYCKLYVYRSGTHWGVSNSFSRLVEGVRSKGWPVSPNPAMLATWSFAGAFWQQFTTFETAAVEISVLPRQHSLIVDERGMLKVRSEERSPDRPDSAAYRAALGKFIQSWVGRLGTTLRAPGTQMVSELTGGLDSRVTLSLLLALRQFFPTSFGSQLSLSSGLSYPEDLQIAKAIAAAYRLRVNPKLTATPFGARTHDPFERWTDFALGSYGPIYWPAASSANGRFVVGGHGGEGHRAYWRYASPRSVLEANRENFQSPAMFAEVSESFDRTSEVLGREYPGVPATVAHYREFRDRLHSGLHAQQQIRLQPLASSLMYEASSQLSSDALERGQMLYDVVGQSAPGLLAMPYDKPQKSPSEAVLRNLVDPVAINPMRGQVFGLSEAGPQAPTSTRVSPWEAARERFESAAACLPDGLVAREVVDSGRDALSELRSSGRLKHPKYSRPIHHVILAGLVSS